MSEALQLLDGQRQGTVVRPICMGSKFISTREKTPLRFHTSHFLFFFQIFVSKVYNNILVGNEKNIFQIFQNFIFFKQIINSFNIKHLSNQKKIKNNPQPPKKPSKNSLPSVQNEDLKDKFMKTPINVKFEIPYFTVSGVTVRYLKIIEKSGYQALPWVRYITMNGDYQVKMS